MHMCPNCGTNLKRFQGMQFGNVAILPDGHIYLNNERLMMPPTQMVLAEALIKAEGRTLTREMLAGLTGNLDLETQTVAVYIMRIRRSAEKVLKGFDQLESVYGVGYRWQYREAPKLALVA